jgi:hypothetical protein
VLSSRLPPLHDPGSMRCRCACVHVCFLSVCLFVYLYPCVLVCICGCMCISVCLWIQAVQTHRPLQGVVLSGGVCESQGRETCSFDHSCTPTEQGHSESRYFIVRGMRFVQCPNVVIRVNRERQTTTTHLHSLVLCVVSCFASVDFHLVVADKIEQLYYPVNLLRNFAWLQVSTPLFLSADFDFLVR